MAGWRLSRPQRRALAALHPSILRQFEDLRGVKWRTIASMMMERPGRPALVREISLKPPCWLKVPYTHFYVLTDAGAATLGKSTK